MSEAQKLRIGEHVPMLVCTDVQASIKFYCDLLGFEVADRMDDVGLTGWASLTRGTNRIMLTSASYLKAPEKNEDGSLDSDVIHYFHCEDVVGIHSHLKNAGISVSDFYVRFYRKKEIEFFDPDGRLLIFGEDTEEEPTPE
ncbi:MAG: VOC family protein [Gammaproteobacteria bacterium]|nr:VOC family protein [Gammaproteobacteria bacterium]